MNQAGSFENASVIEMLDPTPSANTIRVKVQAIGLNPVDYKLIENGFEGWNYPRPLGLDAAGIIDALGGDVKGWRKGERVYFHSDITKPGVSSEYVIVPEHTLSRIPDGISFEVAASLPCPAFTAYQAVFQKLRLHKNDIILIHGGSGAVGGYSIQFAKNFGAKVIATASPRNYESAKAIGADWVLDYRDPNLAKTVSEITSHNGVRAVIDTIGGHSTIQAFSMIDYFGEIVCVAGLPDSDKIPHFEKSFSLHEIAIGAAFTSENVRAQTELSRIGSVVMNLLVSGALKPLPIETISLSEIPDALFRLRSRKTTRKIVARI